MKLVCDKKENAMTIVIEGRLDTVTAPELDKIISEDLESVSDLVLDLAKLEYISSAGLRVILKAQKLMNTKGSMSVANANDDVMEIFDITGFSDILTII